MRSCARATVVQNQQARSRGSPFALVNGATAQQVLCLAVPEGVALDKPVHILHIATGQTAQLPTRAVHVHLHILKIQEGPQQPESLHRVLQ